MKIYNEYFEAEFSEKGGEIVSLVDKKTGLQYMYQGDSPYWSGKNPTLFPIVGNTYDGTYEAKGNTYTFKNHGLIRYATLTCIEHKEDRIVFELKANEETLQHYPYAFTYHIAYSFNDKGLNIEYEIMNEDEEVMPFTFGLHPGFRVPMFDDECYEDYSISFDQEETMEQLIFDPNKQVPHHYEPITMKSLQLDYALMEKYATLIYRGYENTSVTLQGKHDHGVRVHFEGFPLLALWSPKDAPFVCIEPWFSHADFENSHTRFEERYGMMKLDPKETFTISYQIEIF